MKNIILILIVGLLIQNIAYSGDCFFHPRFIHEVKVKSCSVLSASNASEISFFATPDIVAARYPGAILKVIEKQVMQINLPENGIKYEELPWKITGKEKVFLLRSNNTEICSKYGVNSLVIIRTETDCECDTGPSHDGYCTLGVKEAYESSRKR